MRIVVSWSSGKDSAWALHRLRSTGADVAGLLTTVTLDDRVTNSHRVPYPLVRRQAAAVGLPLRTLALPDPCPNDIYEERMARMGNSMASRGVTHLAYGDLHLADIRAYREEMMAVWPLEPLFPIWGEPTDRLATEMVDAGVDATIVCVDPDRVDPTLCGTRWDPGALPTDIDPLGENGEFHTFCHQAPGFTEPVRAEVEETYTHHGLVWARLSP